jgi:hypothetical protein
VRKPPQIGRCNRGFVFIRRGPEKADISAQNAPSTDVFTKRSATCSLG